MFRLTAARHFWIPRVVAAQLDMIQLWHFLLVVMMKNLLRKIPKIRLLLKALLYYPPQRLTPLLEKYLAFFNQFNRPILTLEQ